VRGVGFANGRSEIAISKTKLAGLAAALAEAPRAEADALAAAAERALAANWRLLDGVQRAA
jgi:hypothetical protein